MNESPSISIDQLTALNEEMAALVRAGIPLDKGLTQLGREMSGKGGTLAGWLGQRLDAGADLEELLDRDDTPLPSIWRAVVKAGMKSGDLAAALEGMAQTGRQIVDLRRTVTLSLLYPALLVILGYALFLWTIMRTVPSISAAMSDLTPVSSSIITAFTWLRIHVIWWAPWVPLLPLMLMGFWWWHARRLPLQQTRHRSATPRQRRWLWPSIRSLLHDGRMATFSELLALLNRHDVPLADALVLAADSTGDPRMARDARAFSQRLKAGQFVQRREDLPPSLPPLLAWSVTTAHTPLSLQHALLNTAHMYRRRAEQTARWAATYLPICLTIFIGSIVVLTQGLLLFVPITQLLYALEVPG